jgi:hypothetical protein
LVNDLNRREGGFPNNLNYNRLVARLHSSPLSLVARVLEDLSKIQQYRTGGRVSRRPVSPITRPASPIPRIPAPVSRPPPTRAEIARHYALVHSTPPMHPAWLKPYLNTHWVEETTMLPCPCFASCPTGPWNYLRLVLGGPTWPDRPWHALSPPMDISCVPVKHSGAFSALRQIPLLFLDRRGDHHELRYVSKVSIGDLVMEGEDGGDSFSLRNLAVIDSSDSAALSASSQVMVNWSSGWDRLYQLGARDTCATPWPGHAVPSVFPEHEADPPSNHAPAAGSVGDASGSSPASSAHLDSCAADVPAWLSTVVVQSEQPQAEQTVSSFCGPAPCTSVSSIDVSPDPGQPHFTAASLLPDSRFTGPHIPLSLMDPLITKSSATEASLTQLGPEVRTTLLLEGLPPVLTRDMFVLMLNSLGLFSFYDFVFLPVNFSSGLGIGQAFVNCLSPAGARQLWDIFDGLSDWSIPSDSICTVSWLHHQGLRTLVQRFRDHPIRQADVPDAWCPALYNQGVRVAFPHPLVDKRPNYGDPFLPWAGLLRTERTLPAPREAPPPDLPWSVPPAQQLQVKAPPLSPIPTSTIAGSSAGQTVADSPSLGLAADGVNVAHPSPTGLMVVPSAAVHPSVIAGLECPGSAFVAPVSVQRPPVKAPPAAIVAGGTPSCVNLNYSSVGASHPGVAIAGGIPLHTNRTSPTLPVGSVASASSSAGATVPGPPAMSGALISAWSTSPVRDPAPVKAPPPILSTFVAIPGSGSHCPAALDAWGLPVILGPAATSAGLGSYDPWLDSDGDFRKPAGDPSSGGSVSTGLVAGPVPHTHHTTVNPWLDSNTGPTGAGSSPPAPTSIPDALEEITSAPPPAFVAGRDSDLDTSALAAVPVFLDPGDVAGTSPLQSFSALSAALNETPDTTPIVPVAGGISSSPCNPTPPVPPLCDRWFFWTEEDWTHPLESSLVVGSPQLFTLPPHPGELSEPAGGSDLAGSFCYPVGLQGPESGSVRSFAG